MSTKPDKLANSLKCVVYKSLKKDDTYVYLAAKDDLTILPKELLSVLGKTEKIMVLLLTPDKKMARGTAKEIMESIAAKDFYLQMPQNPQLMENPLAKSNERFLDKNM